jgi:hypothetical protein
MRLFRWNMGRRQFITLGLLGLPIPAFMRANNLFATDGTTPVLEKTKGVRDNVETPAVFIPNDKESELRQKNIKTIDKWLTFSGASRHKDRLTVYTEDFMSGNPAVKDSSQSLMGRAAVEAMAAEAEAHPEKETFQGWHFYNARIYAAVDDPNLFDVNCLGKGTVITSEHPEGIVYQNHYTHYFRMRDGLIQAWWETVVDTPGSGSKPPWEETDRKKPPMVTFCEGERP